MKVRDPVFDVVKWLVMVFVVSGHVAGNDITYRGDSSLTLFFGNFTMAVSMPLFFMISGYFAVRAFENGNVSKIIARIVGFLWPLASFGAVFGAVLFICGKASWLKMIAYPLVRAYGGSWFLSTLATIFAISAVVFRYVKTDKMRWFVFCLVYVALFFTAGQGGIASLFRFSSILHMFPYFVFGLMVLKPFEVYKISLVAIPCGIFLLAVVFLEGDVRSNGMAFYWVPSDWQTVVADGHLLLCFFARTAVGIAGSIFVLWAVDKLLKLVPQLSRLAVFGTTTLGVYVMHEWPLMQIHKYFQFEPLSSYWRWPLALALFLTCHYFTVLIRRYSISKFIFFGDEKLLSSKLDLVFTKCFSR